MIVPFSDLLAAAREEGRALGGFTVYDLPAAVGVLRAAQTAGTGVLLLLSAGAFRAPAGPALLVALRALVERAPVPAAVQLDHVSDLDTMADALALGAGAVMADGSQLPFEENVALVRAAGEIARAHGAGVEAELGRVEGDEEIALAAAAGALTDPGQAADYMRRTGADCLAVSIGNVHGSYARTPELDWPRLAAVRAAVPTPLSLHGASGLPAADVGRAVAAGIAKVNVNTELRQRWFATVGERASELAQGAKLLALQDALADDLARVAQEKLGLLAGARSEA